MSEPTLQEALARARVYDLGQPYWNGMPVHPFDPPFQSYLYRYHEYVRKSFDEMGIEPGFSDAISIMITSNHAGTHFDLPIHMSQDNRVMGIDVTPYQRDTGFKDLPEPLHSLEQVPPLVLRAVLLDVAAFRNEEVLPERHPITPEELEGCAEQAGGIREGDCVLIRTGYGRYFETDRDIYLNRWAGLGDAAAHWLAGRGPRLVGIDNLSLGVPAPFASHRIILVEKGIYVMKSLNLEALAADGCTHSTVIVLPLPIRGGEASLVRPIALV
ncbi:MAG: cyclase family protein [Gammaproteobacteria bacterium]|nr:MAG: cyclase family protein [Gammaproteobacteria bacterium]